MYEGTHATKKSTTGNVKGGTHRCKSAFNCICSDSSTDAYLPKSAVASLLVHAVLVLTAIESFGITFVWEKGNSDGRRYFVPGFLKDIACFFGSSASFENFTKPTLCEMY